MEQEQQIVFLLQHCGHSIDWSAHRCLDRVGGNFEFSGQSPCKLQIHFVLEHLFVCYPLRLESRANRLRISKISFLTSSIRQAQI